jgi:antitoxin CptB
MSAPDASKDAHLADDTTRRRRLLFRATHRGTHENDLLIGGFVRARLDSLSEADLAALEEVVELPDPVLADWLTGRKPIPPEADRPILRAMRDAALAEGPSPPPSPGGRGGR